MATNANITTYGNEILTTDANPPTNITTYGVEVLTVLASTTLTNITTYGTEVAALDANPPTNITTYGVEILYHFALPPFALSGMYYIHLGKTNDTVYLTNDAAIPPVTTIEDRAIPDPFIETALIGDK